MDNVELWGSSFVADVDFGPALQQAETFDAKLQAIEKRIAGMATALQGLRIPGSGGDDDGGDGRGGRGQPEGPMGASEQSGPRPSETLRHGVVAVDTRSGTRYRDERGFVTEAYAKMRDDSRTRQRFASGYGTELFDPFGLPVSRGGTSDPFTGQLYPPGFGPSRYNPARIRHLTANPYAYALPEVIQDFPTARPGRPASDWAAYYRDPANRPPRVYDERWGGPSKMSDPGPRALPAPDPNYTYDNWQAVPVGPTGPARPGPGYTRQFRPPGEPRTPAGDTVPMGWQMERYRPPNWGEPQWGSGFYMPDMRRSMPVMGMLGAAGSALGQGLGQQGLLGGFGSLYNTGRTTLNPFSPQRLVSAASSIYLLDSLSGVAAGVGRRTIGESMRLQEYQTLLENTLISPDIGISRERGAALAEHFINTRYLAGFDISTAQLGLSRVELAEQFRGLAPVVRLGAENPMQFQAGLQQGALASALLLARDPTQGNRGVNVALSELYSGGPTRFRSLAERFELPRSRLYEVETAMGGEGTADPGAVVLRVLEMMGFGPEYLQRRAQTLPGQLDRSGALLANARADAFTQATETITRDITNLNNAFEQFASSEAYTQTLSWFDRLIGGALSWPVGMTTNWMAGNLIGTQPGREAQSFAEDVAGRLLVTGGEFRSSRGEVLSAAQALREAALAVSSIDLQSIVNAPAWQPGMAMRNQMALGGAATIGGGALLNWLMFGNLGRALTAGSWAAAAPMLGVGAGAAGIALGAAGAVGAGMAGFNLARTTNRAAETIDPSLLEEAFGQRRAEDIQDRAPWRAVDTYVQDWLSNLRTRGRWGEEQYGQRWATEASTMGELSNLNDFRTLLSQRINRTYDPFSTPEQVEEQARQLLLQDLIPSVLPDSPLYDTVNQIGFVPETLDWLMRDYQQVAPGETAESNLRSGLKTAANYRQPFITTDPLTGESRIWSNPTEDTVGEIQSAYSHLDSIQFLSMVTTAVEHLKDISQNTAATAEVLSPYRYINVTGLPGLWGGYEESPDPRYVGATGMMGTNVTQVPTAGDTTATGALEGRPNVEVGTLMSAAQREVLPWSSRNQIAALFGGGTVTSDYGPRGIGSGSDFHRGVDIDIGDPMGYARAPIAGTAHVLDSPEAYAASPFGEMFGGAKGYESHGNTVVITDPTGLYAMSMSHMRSEGLVTPGEIAAGAVLGREGNTGLAMSGNPGMGFADPNKNRVQDPGEQMVAYEPDTLLRHGYDAAGNYYPNVGAHVHAEAFIANDTGGWQSANPVFAPALAEVGPGLQSAVSGNIPMSVQVGDIVLNIDPSNLEEMKEQARAEAGKLLDSQIEAAFERLQRDGIFSILLEQEGERNERRGTTVSKGVW